MHRLSFNLLKMKRSLLRQCLKKKCAGIVKVKKENMPFLNLRAQLMLPILKVSNHSIVPLGEQFVSNHKCMLLNVSRLQ